MCILCQTQKWNSMIYDFSFMNNFFCVSINYFYLFIYLILLPYFLIKCAFVRRWWFSQICLHNPLVMCVCVWFFDIYHLILSLYDFFLFLSLFPTCLRKHLFSFSSTNFAVFIFIYLFYFVRYQTHDVFVCLFSIFVLTFWLRVFISLFTFSSHFTFISLKIMLPNIDSHTNCSVLDVCLEYISI